MEDPMRAILTTSAIASLLLVTGVTIPSPSAFTQDNQPCVGENCPKPDTQGEQGRKKYDQDTEDQTGQTPMRKKRIQGSTDQGDVQNPGDTRNPAFQLGMPRVRLRLTKHSRIKI
jgi:hypothetical protein